MNKQTRTPAISARRRFTVALGFGLALFIITFGVIALHAQTPADASLQAAMDGGLSEGILHDPAVQAAIKAAVPPQYEGWVTLALLLLMAWGRFHQARKNGHDVPSAIGTVLNGANTPTPTLLMSVEKKGQGGSATTKLQLLLGMLCLLSLSSCAFLASPAGVALTQLGLNLAVERGKVSQGDVVTIQRGLAIVTNPEDSTVMKVFDLTELGLGDAVRKGKLKTGDSVLIQDAMAIIQRAVVPVQPGAKQPVSVNP